MERDARSAGLKEKATEEFKLYLVVVAYLWVVLGSFTVYRRLVGAESGVPYLHYGVAIIEALIIGKVILIGNLFGFTRRFDERPLIVPVLYKSMLFAALVLAFGIGEHLVKGWINKQGLFGGLRGLRDVGVYELGARVLMLVAALVPFFAFSEIARVMGAHKLSTLFFSKRATPDPVGSAAT